ncbi:MAG: ATP-binding protein, partial [Chitinophagales bacterium]|nr:ATP-binding protein [Chitinophagales bacterium]
ARDLHDSIGQKLAVMRMLLPPSSQQGEMSKFVQFLDETAREVRAISHNLIPEILNFGLVKGLESLTHRINSTEKINAHFSAEEKISGLSLTKETEVSLFRVVQELLSNIIRHAHCNNIHIQLSATGHTLKLDISEDGKGFNPGSIEESQGLGWKNIFARVKLMNGEIKIRSQKNEGSQFTIKIPVN